MKPPYHPAPAYKPTPAPYHPPPSYKPAPYHPAPSYKPAPYHPAPSYKTASYHPEPQYKEEAKPFAYDYAVNDRYSGASFAKKEESDGHNTQGYYSVALPDGRVQHVKYVADHYGGYNAEVTYEGEATYPDYHPAPAYKAAAPAYKAAYSRPAPAYKAAAY
ncbi:cuticle protein 7-like [Pollicipes pollicipes]|uniref:cuticle protein 7-like n=1 Tax=Pollicipes pollicipes TaxID=41117 RepID=UPI001884BA02|nr:cuticle protein 7-like [Pollicipes pollicipes]